MNVSRKLFQLLFLCAGVVIFGGSFSGHAAVATVVVGTNNSTTFNPAVTNINTGDSVVWVWNYSSASENHSTTSGTNGVPSGLWGSLTNHTPYFYTNKFNNAGTYLYYCGIHFISPFNMTGAVIVAAANLPPTVAITNPLSGAVFAAPANVTIHASASGNGGTLTNVEFLANSTVLGSVKTAPYSVVANSLAAGGYILSAIAANSSGLTATNSVSVSVVNPVPIVLSAPALLSAANFRFSFAANAGLNYVVQRSTNLLSADWINLGTNLAGGSSVTFTDVNATVNPEFYRVSLLPNP